jgi:peptidoglycan/LPS O-acetylase OafA/YrhL
MAFGLLPPGWSLAVELAMSMVFPAWLWLGRRLHPLAPLALSVALLWPLGPSLHFLVFSFDFALGIALCLGFAPLGRALSSWTGPAAAACVLVALALLQAPYALSLREAGRAGLDAGHTPAVIALMGLGSALLVAGALHVPALRGLLSRAPLRHLGRVSYSLYLLHYLVLIQIVCRVTGTPLSWPRGLAVFAVVMGLSLALSELGWRAVEAPSIRAGRALIRAAERVAGRR